MLTVFLDSASIDAVYDEKHNLIDNLRSSDASLFRIFRTKCDINKNEVKKIHSRGRIEKNSFNETGLNIIYQKLSFQPKNDSQEQFFFYLLKYADPTKKADYVHESVYVTENPIFFEKFLPGGTKQNCLRDFFPKLILANLERIREIMDYYEKNNGVYYFDHVKLKLKEEWYFMTLFSRLSELPLAISRYNQYEKMITLLRSLAFRVRKLFYCMDCIGIEHYFGNIKKDPIDHKKVSNAISSLKKGTANISDFQGFIDPDNLFNLFYHAEYLIALITGVFDNLALLTKDRYGIRHDIIRVSFSNEDFMRKVEAYNIALKRDIDQYHNFISLIYKFREQVIHREGLIQVISPIVINWSSFIKITSEISKYIKQCGDARSEYKFISNWGVFERGSDLLLDPYYFSKQALFTVLKLTNEYLRQLN